MDDRAADGRARRLGSEGKETDVAVVADNNQVYDPTETRILVTSAPISRTGLLSLLSLSIKADLTISGGLHCE